MRNTIGIKMDPSLRLKPQRSKTMGVVSQTTLHHQEQKTKDSRRSHTVMPTLRARRGSVDSAIPSLGSKNHTTVHHREKSSLSDSDKKSSDKKATIKHDNRHDSKPPVRESKYSVNRICLASRTDNDIKPILKSCAKLTSLQTSISIEDMRVSPTDDRETNKFCYRLPITKPAARKTVSFQEVTDDICQGQRRYTTPSLQLPLNFPSNLNHKYLKT